MDFDFVAIKKGDVNNSAIPNNLLSTQTRTRASNLSLQLDNQLFTSNQKVNIDFNSLNFNEIEGFQFTLFFNPEQLDFENIQSTQLPNWTSNNFNLQRIGEGQITISWNGQPLDLEKDQAVFNLELTAKTNGELVDAIEIRSQPTIAEAYGDGEILGVELISNVTPKTSFALLQNVPNPFSEKTMIEFRMPEEGGVNFSIFNLDGKMIYESNNTFTKGSHQIEINKNEFQQEGVFYYQLKTEFGTATRKMIVIK